VLVVAVGALLFAAPAALALDTSPSPSPPATDTPTDSPSPTPTETVTPTPTPTVGPSDTPPPSPSATPDPTPSVEHGGTPTLVLGAPARAHGRGVHDGRHRGHRAERRRWRNWRPSTDGAWSTRRLDRAASIARRHGWSTARIARDVYAPFPVMGPAAWTDTWGAPRFAGGYHPHAGQDVLCRWGAPVLAVQAATVTYGHNALGGKVAYLTRRDGSFWYYAHLSAQATELEGRRVEQGEIIGRCGATGDATVPHVHFGFVAPNGTMLDPLHALRVMLRQAEASLPGARRQEAPTHVPTPTSVPEAAPLAPWHRGPVDPQAPASQTPEPAPAASLAAGMVVAIGVLGPLTFLYRRTRRVSTFPPPGGRAPGQR
jgi:murein DD-endopeptidase MepM/ murein hydrolase activator NlpD